MGCTDEPLIRQQQHMLYINQIDLKMHIKLINEQIIVNIYGDFEYECNCQMY